MDLTSPLIASCRICFTMSWETLPQMTSVVPKQVVRLQVRQDYCVTDTGPFSNIQSWRYWSSTEYAPITTQKWYFNFYDGNQSPDYYYEEYYAWAVHDADVSAVPVPAAVWLFGSGLIGLMSLTQRKKAA